jgi:2-polyprenyl-3-methyl-5-hydroxy-6-metoxy-1,4-benzoquinol methylase
VTTPSYTFDNAWQQARERLAGIEQAHDPGTRRHLAATGVGPGWHCLEVGAGGGSIADWLCRQVGPSGHVVATDRDTHLLDALDYPQLDARQHNIVTDVLEEAAFDLVHVRLLLHHLPEPELARRRLVAALKPGGWLVAEAPDTVAMVPDPGVNAPAAGLYRKLEAALYQMLRARGGH